MTLANPYNPTREELAVQQARLDAAGIPRASIWTDGSGYFWGVAQAHPSKQHSYRELSHEEPGLIAAVDAAIDWWTNQRQKRA